MHDWPQALDLRWRNLRINRKPDLQPEAAVCDWPTFSADLAQAGYRADLLNALRARPAANRISSSFLAKAPTERQRIHFVTWSLC